MIDSIASYGGPLAFKVLQGQGRSPVLADCQGRDVFKVEARQLVGHQREAVVTEGASGSAWRVTSDEGIHLKGTDLAPFPFGFFNAGLQGDLFHRIRCGAAAGGIVLDALEIDLANEYWLTGYRDSMFHLPLNLPNRRVRTRTHGGVGGGSSRKACPYPDSCPGSARA